MFWFYEFEQSELNLTKFGDTIKANLFTPLSVRPILTEQNLFFSVSTIAIIVYIYLWFPVLNGTEVPGFDFVGGYASSAYSWWIDGGVIAPPEWTPYSWGGYPTVIDIQNSSYYLPYSLLIIANQLPVLTLFATIGFLEGILGAIGAYVFFRSFKLNHGLLPLFGACCWLFLGAAYATTPMPDLHRAFMFLPWMMVVLSGNLDFRKKFSVPMVTLFFWQLFVSIYPGSTLAFGYIAVVVISIVQFRNRPKFTDYLLPISAGALAGLLLSALKWLPALYTRGEFLFSEGNVSFFSRDLIGTFFFSGGNLDLSQPMGLREFLIPITLIPLAFMSIRAKPSQLRLMGVILVFLSITLSWKIPLVSIISSNLPGLNFSRFVLSDFRPVLLFGIVILATMGLQGLTNCQDTQKVRKIRIEAIIASSSVGLTAIFFGLNGNYDQTEVFVQSAVIVVLVLLFFLFFFSKLSVSGLICSAVLLTVFSGFIGSQSTFRYQLFDRIELEMNSYGATIEQLQEKRNDPDISLGVQPQRQDVEEPNYPIKGNAGFYSGIPFLYSYTNLRGQITYESVKFGIIDDETGFVKEFWGDSGAVVTSHDGAFVSQKNPSWTSYKKQFSLGTVTNYSPVGNLEIALRVAGPTEFSINTPFYRGWSAKICDPKSSNQDCRNLILKPGKYGQVVSEVTKAGTWTIQMEYRTPLFLESQLLACCGIAISLLFPIVRTFVRLKKRDTLL
ncbi:hypothetical protein [Aurantimicrobium minutum]|uniref:hypothetical protein n=1 Tax=Aurantimicrobium minutum TaxID=708131 RepID=UPI0024764B22|nr:hypothetical protein [Aurantimicrobium minutum]MDH6239036.1 hypothetical protein [Aurantimicrobium minutum]